jgi:hypothetical protein
MAADHLPVEFLLFGFTRPEGGVEVYGTRHVSMAEILAEWPPQGGSPTKTIKAHVDELWVGHGDEIADALAALLEVW